MKPGAVIAGRYTIEKELGRGGMGAVFVARDSKFGGRVALKIASAAGLTLDEFRGRFSREARIGHRLGRSEGFVRALDWGEIEGSNLYLAMDLVEGAKPLDLTGGTLAERLERLGRAAKLVHTAHALGVVHRDLKPANFLVGADGRIFLADFGLAKSSDVEEDTQAHLTRTGTGMGTPAFMPPEQFEDARSADERADVYALGVMLFVALTGKLPYEGSMTAIMQRQVRVQEGRDKPPRPRSLDGDVSDALDETCARAIALARDERTPSAAAFIQSLEAAVAAAEKAEPTVRPGGAPRVTAVKPPTQGPSAVVRPLTPPPAPAPRALAPTTPNKPSTSSNTVLLVVALAIGAVLFFCCLLMMMGHAQAD